MRSEFEFIQHIKKQYSLSAIGDDCAVLPKDSDTDNVVTTDMLVETIDFRLDWTTPELLGHKALTVSLSDIAAMGAAPRWAMLSIGVPEELWTTDFLDRFYDGYIQHAKRARVELIGGDVSRSPDRLVIDSIVGGEVPKGKAILRSGAKTGDAIVVTFRLGGAAGGLRLLQNGRRLTDDLESWEANLINMQLQPWPQLGTGPFLQQIGVISSMIDISDGVSSDLLHICNASGVGARLDREKIPIDPNLHHLWPSPDEQWNAALNGGEDFQLLFTLPSDQVPQLAENMIGGNDHGLFTVIGEITSNPGIIEVVRDGRTEILEPHGFQHFE